MPIGRLTGQIGDLRPYVGHPGNYKMNTCKPED